MSNIIDFPNANELAIDVKLEGITLADVLENLYEQNDIAEAVIIYRSTDGEISAWTDMDEDGVRLLTDEFTNIF